MPRWPGCRGGLRTAISVSTQVETDGNPSRLTFNLTETDGKWRIDAVG
ncbi:MAG: hypothetical protein H0V29_00715 [Thermoleophilaceae bacterium]|nr:hypothetical protein [Thermoleophilaceae bacterium]